MSAGSQFATAAEVPFEALLGPYAEERRGDALTTSFRPAAQHVVAEDVDPAALLAFGDFTMFAIVNAASHDRYADRAARQGETIVTAGISAHFVGRPRPGAELRGRGTARERSGGRRIDVAGVVEDGDRPLMLFSGRWTRTRVAPPEPVPATPPSSQPTWRQGALDDLTGPFLLEPSGGLSVGIERKHCNLLGIAHGGMILTLISAAHRAKPGRCSLRSLSVDFLAPGLEGELLTAELQVFGGAHSASIGRVSSGSKEVASFSAAWDVDAI